MPSTANRPDTGEELRTRANQVVRQSVARVWDAFFEWMSTGLMTIVACAFIAVPRLGIAQTVQFTALALTAVTVLAAAVTALRLWVVRGAHLESDGSELLAVDRWRRERLVPISDIASADLVVRYWPGTTIGETHLIVRRHSDARDLMLDTAEWDIDQLVDFFRDLGIDIHETSASMSDRELVDQVAVVRLATVARRHYPKLAFVMALLAFGIPVVAVALALR